MPDPDLDPATVRARFTALCDEALRAHPARLSPDETMALLDSVVDQMAREFGEDIRVRCWVAIAQATTTLYPDPVSLN